ncbi:MAG: PilZ domain-containing protein [Pseudomonadota bacterium]
MTAARTEQQYDFEDEDGAERRKHRRIPVSLEARFLAPDGKERDCTVVNISAGGLRLVSEHEVAKDDKVVLYVEHVGRFDCTVVRPTSNGFAVRFEIQAKKRERTVEALSRFLLQGAASGAPDGDSKRQQPRVASEANTELTLSDGTTAACKVLDISLTGASIEIENPPPVGAMVQLGRMKAKVARHHDDGAGLMFLRDDVAEPRITDIVESVGGEDAS